MDAEDEADEDDGELNDECRGGKADNGVEATEEGLDNDRNNAVANDVVEEGKSRFDVDGLSVGDVI